MANKSQNRLNWERQTSILQKRLNKLQQMSDDEISITIPSTPSRVTNKSLKMLAETETEIKRAEEEQSQIRISKKRQEYDDISTAYHRHKNNIISQGNPQNLVHKGNPQNLVHKGNPKGNPQNLVHKGRPKGSKNKNGYNRKKISEIPQTPDTIGFVDELLYDRIQELMKESLSHNIQGGVFLRNFFTELENMYGKDGMLIFLHSAIQKGYILEIYFYDSDIQDVLYVVSNIVETLDADEYGKLQDRVRQLNEAYENMATPDADDIFRFADEF